MGGAPIVEIGDHLSVAGSYRPSGGTPEERLCPHTTSVLPVQTMSCPSQAEPPVMETGLHVSGTHPPPASAPGRGAPGMETIKMMPIRRMVRMAGLLLRGAYGPRPCRRV